MGNEPSIPQSVEEDRVLYRIELIPGTIIFSEPNLTLPRIDTDVEESRVTPAELSVELVVTCERGEVGPIPVSQLQSNQERVIESWHVDVGDPKYCIVVVYRSPGRLTPTWTIRKCTVTARRRHKTTTKRYRHSEDMTGGSGVVYSVTMSAYETEEDNEANAVRTVARHERRFKDKHQE